MKKTIIFLILVNITLISIGQIIADHTVVDKFDKIPPSYMAEIKKMMVAFPGESHSAAYRKGMELLEILYPEYACNVSKGEAYTDQYVRVENWGWTGENVWFTAGPSAYLKSEIISYKNAGHPFNILGFAWCSDLTEPPASTGIDPVFGVHWFGRSEGGPQGNLAWGIDAEDFALTGNTVCLQTYFNAMENYIAHCQANSPSTRMVFTTGPVDSDGEWIGEQGYQGHIKHEAIRNYVRADPSRILFDYADILCHDDNGTMNTRTWDGKTYPSITVTNELPRTTSHISDAGSVRLAKAQWWLLARLAGWDGVITDVKKNEFSEKLTIITDHSLGELKISGLGNWIGGRVDLFNINGTLLQSKTVAGDLCSLGSSMLDPGVYIVTATRSGKRITGRVVIARKQD